MEEGPMETWYIVETRAPDEHGWREVVRSADKSEARFGLWEYIERNPGWPVRVRDLGK